MKRADWLALTGFILITLGVSLVSRPAAVICAGLILVRLAYVDVDRMGRRGKPEQEIQ